MAGASVATIKRLYAVSGNLCAFPKCSVPLVDKASNKVTGRICHIKAQQPGGPRYDPNQTEEERHGFANLVLMCPIHHDVIDNDVESYTVERLTQIKNQHESQQPRESEISDATAQQFVVNVSANSISNGSIIFTQNQMGGQTAHSITNIGPQRRLISVAAANELIRELQKYPSETVRIMAVVGDADTDDLANVLDSILRKAGWITGGVGQAMIAGFSAREVMIQTPVEKVSLTILLNWMSAVGLNPTSHISLGLQEILIIVGPRK